MKSNLPDELRRSGDVPADVPAGLARVSPRLDRIARRIHWLDTTGSTNDVAARLADLGVEEGTIVVAEAQTAGRGRHGRTWFSPPGAGLYVSIVLKPASAAPLITLASGVAIAEGIRAATALPVELKWPNDIIFERRKLGGVLTESSAQPGARPQVVVGFGVNIQATAYPSELAARATSIESETGRPVDRGLILAEILAAFAGRYADLRSGKFDAILSAWRRLAPTFTGSPVEWDGPGGVMRGRVLDIDREGALLVRVGDTVERIVAGEVRWRSS